MSISFMDLFEELDISDAFLVLGDDIFVLDTGEGIAIFEVAVGVLPEGFVASHSHSSVVMSVTRSVVGCLVVGLEDSGQCCLGGDAFC
jgi:hypothetical protein